MTGSDRLQFYTISEDKIFLVNYMIANMSKTTKILVPIDFSACSKGALNLALQLANNIGAEVLVLTVSTLDTGYIDNALSANLIIQDQIRLLRKRLTNSVEEAVDDLLSSTGKAPTIQTHVGLGRVEATICDEASKNLVDYVILGTQGENSTLDKYLGSVASNVLKNAPCPVMVVPENVQLQQEVILGYATDYSDADPYEIWKATKLFESFRAKLKCVHFIENPETYHKKQMELKSYFSETNPELEVEVYCLPLTDKVKDMNDFIENQKINIMVMYKPKRNFFEYIMHKSYTQKMAKHSKIPLLIFKEVKY